jgi:hypothetical protein
MQDTPSPTPQFKRPDYKMALPFKRGFRQPWVAAEGATYIANQVPAAPSTWDFSTAQSQSWLHFAALDALLAPVW